MPEATPASQAEAVETRRNPLACSLRRFGEAKPEPTTRRKRLGLASVILVFIASRLITYRIVPFATLDPDFFQYIDPQLLRSDLLRSLFYLHSQPPLFNLFIGAVLKVFPVSYTPVFRVVFTALGLALGCSLFLLMTGLGIRDTSAAILTILFIVSPSCILYENWFYNTYPSAVVLCVGTLGLNDYLKGGKCGAGILFLSLLASLVLLNSTFQLLWAVAALLLVRWLAAEKLKKLDAASLGVCLLLAALYLKNFLLFGTFTTSSWVGMNLARISTFQLNEPQRMRLVAERSLLPLALIGPLTGLDHYAGLIGPVARTNVPVLDERVKAGGAPNYNNAAYLALSRAYLKDALFVIAHYPSAYWRGVRSAIAIYAEPATQYFFLDYELGKIRNWDRIYRAALIPFSLWKHRLLLLQVLAFPGLWIFGAWSVFREVQSQGYWPARSITISFMLLSILYVTVAVNGFELLENNRLRFVVDPLYMVLAGLFVGDCAEKVRRRAARAG